MARGTALVHIGLTLLAASVLQISGSRVTPRKAVTTRADLCAPEVVAKVCEDLGFVGGKFQVPELIKVVWASEDSVHRVLRKIKYGGWAKLRRLLGFKSGYALKCQDLCEKTVARIGEDSPWRLPPAIDTGCRRGVGDEPRAVCDIDLSDDAMGPVLSDSPSRHGGPSSSDHGRTTTSGHISVMPEYPSHVMIRKVANLFRIYPMLSTTTLQDTNGGTVLKDSADDLDKLNSEDEEGVSSSLGEFNSASTDITASIGPTYEALLVGDRVRSSYSGGGPAVGTVLSINGEEVRVRFDNGKERTVTRRLITAIGLRVGDNVTAHYMTGGNRESEGSDDGTILRISPVDGSVKVRFQDGIEQKLPFSWVQSFSHNGVTRKPLTEHLPKTPLDAKILSGIEARSVQAQKYVSKAIRDLRQPSTAEVIEKWYGRGVTRAKTDRLSELLNNLDAMLANVHYIYPGPNCEPDTYAYVYPDSLFTRTDDGQFIFYLCELYRKTKTWKKDSTVPVEAGTSVKAHYQVNGGSRSDGVDIGVVNNREPGGDVEITFQDGITQTVPDTWISSVGVLGDTPSSIQIETLTHEGSHHKPSRTNDMCIDGTEECDADDVAYGRETCEELAKQHPEGALQNADSFCYFVNDVNGAFDR